MLTLIVKGKELFNEETQEFIDVDDVVLELEHSLVSLSKWETRYKKPFLSTSDKSKEEIIGYVECMTLTKDYPIDVFTRLSDFNLKEINAHIQSEESATTFRDTPAQKARGISEVVTAELIYFWMVSYQVPFECENWHLNKLFTLLRICNIKNSKEKKMSRSEIAMRNRELNEQRKAKLGTSG